MAMGSFTKASPKNYPLPKQIKIIWHTVSARRIKTKFCLTKNGPNKSVSIMECFEFLYEGPELGSTGQRVTEWTAR